jgi:hypothetical protein
MNIFFFSLVIINISKFLQQVFSHEGSKGVDLQELDIVSQLLGFLYGIIGMRFVMLVGQKTYIAKGNLLSKTRVQFSPKFLQF